MPLRPGLYDSPVTRSLDSQLADSLALVEELAAHEGSLALARLLFDRLLPVLDALRAQGVEAQVAVVNSLLVSLEAASKGVVSAEDSVALPARRLTAVLEPVAAPRVASAPARPRIALSTSDLLVNGRHDLSIGPEVKREIASADRIDLLLSFLKFSGLRMVRDELAAHLQRRPGSVRVLTTTYTGATELRALRELDALGADIRVSYDSARTRLHAKAWLFHRDSGFSTGYVGSSNLSGAAMLDGMEWNVRLSQVDNGAILEKFHTTFEQYWADPEFRPFDADEFHEAITHHKRERAAPLLKFDIRPKAHQQEILDELSAERAHGRMRNLVVAATGTGKTVVAALDFKRLRPDYERLLFVAHRKEILQQSRDTFRVVLRDGAFGEELFAGDKPDQWDHVFASIQSLSGDVVAKIPPDHFDVVIVDEFHHAAAKSYDDLLTHLQPKVLVGLTATPERADGKSVLHHFGGRIASEIRLWKALDQGLLSPFQYFGLAGPDVSGVKWSGGRYAASELSNVYTSDHLFVKRILQELHAKVADVTWMKALGFCVDIAHAEFMAAEFVKAGIAAAAVSATTKQRERDAALRDLEHGKLQIVFSVDLFNEGVDVPRVDTIVFLRPTESATVFLQQLGRGLRLAEGKECCTVLDFIGTAHRKFRYDARFRAIVGGTPKGVERQVREGFPSLPSGCFIQLDEASQAAVLENIKAALGAGRRALVGDLQSLAQTKPDIGLAEFLELAGVELEDVYGKGWSWTELRRRAGLEKREGDPTIERAFSRMLHIDDAARLTRLSDLARARAVRADASSVWQRMLYVLLGQMGPYSEMQAFWDALWAKPHLLSELRQLLAILEDRSRLVALPYPGVSGLMVHGTYGLLEVMAAVDERTKKDGVKKIQTGVYYVRRLRTDLFFVTLEKSEKHYSPTTLYNDYPISPTRFHWESQSSCHAGTPTGRRYVGATKGSGQNVLLFVRERTKDARGETMPYRFLGRCWYRSHTGARPMAIEWDLEHAMPAGFYQEVKVAAG